MKLKNSYSYANIKIQINKILIFPAWYVQTRILLQTNNIRESAFEGGVQAYTNCSEKPSSLQQDTHLCKQV